ncbi:MerR family transcriptional regulator [Actinomadura darangshiensis]|uniref:MerR family transcriptional regulator n=1 Tax=Actinomadura darangshiensis TaxID=705336 RepID=A0A4R5BAV5_9ACTN|nr:MerR family transcriptional regulator [Actinomadura darangshiensis]TDD80874.1 MerR family transcriptional regulator [Actinomadura darangshiensis]
MDGRGRYSIGELARISGVTVKAVRFYSERGLVPEAGRTAAGHRRYGAAAVERLGLVRTLRELGIDLAAIQTILDKRIPAAQVAAAHAEAVAVQMRVLRLRYAVLSAAARRGATTEEMDLMHRLALMSAAERDRLVADFLDSTFGDPDTAPLSRVLHRSLSPELPDDPTSEQLEAWVELAELTQDPGFRSLMRGLFTDSAVHDAPAPPRKHIVARVVEAVGPLMAAGDAVDSTEAARAVEEIVGAYADLHGRPDDAALRNSLAAHLAAANDPRRERYEELLSIINGWGPPEFPHQELDWFLAALAQAERG